MNIGENLNIQLASTGQRCWGEIVGLKKDKYLLVETGKNKNSLAFLPEDVVTVRCVSNNDGVLCGFRTTVARYLTEPFPQVILHFPQDIEQMQLRNETRYHCFSPVTVHHGNLSCEGMLINISEHGGKVVLAEGGQGSCVESQECPFLEDQKISLDIRPLGAVAPVTVDAVIKRVTIRDGGITLGVFVDSVPEDGTIFLEFIERCRKFSELV
ncbi:PilZ domain-containing protein [Halodesulfovibrio aestuarii]|uniref:PilZ domain-containing protein n=2 Tax=Halodesulfovibrio aestuarii TaxID=126333 RepID=A0A8G2C8S5_9BACT|nr:PilZ domain-containing protein [Halodesulfovibrio aestuarii]SHI97512.1 PilZ domain-containing protein [Halodesulfovibrio aestuarii]